MQGKAAIDPLLVRGQKLVLPIFPSPRSAAHEAVARKVKEVLAARGVEVEIRTNPEVGVYTLGYDPTDAEKAENARADRGEVFGRIKRTTTNKNDWFAALGGWRFGRPVVLLDLAGGEPDCPPAESLGAAGLLWPRVDEAFPGPGRAVVQGVHWAFAPHVNAVVIRATDEAGLLAGAAALADLPEDVLTASVEAARARLWQERRVGPPATLPAAGELTSEGLKASHAPEPLRQDFPKERPPTAEQAAALAPKAPAVEAVPIPATFSLKTQVTPLLRDGERFIEATANEFLLPDLRFSQGLRLVADVREAGKTRVTVTGLFRYSDRTPMTAAQWENVLKLYNEVVPKERRPMEIEVLVGGKPAGKLTPGRTETKDVPVEMSPSHGQKDVPQGLGGSGPDARRRR